MQTIASAVLVRTLAVIQLLCTRLSLDTGSGRSTQGEERGHTHKDGDDDLILWVQRLGFGYVVSLVRAICREIKLTKPDSLRHTTQYQVQPTQRLIISFILLRRQGKEGRGRLTDSLTHRIPQYPNLQCLVQPTFKDSRSTLEFPLYPYWWDLRDYVFLRERLGEGGGDLTGGVEGAFLSELSLLSFPWSWTFGFRARAGLWICFTAGHCASSISIVIDGRCK
jgi:hypothetical protein